jgi:hypothetical protein
MDEFHHNINEKWSMTYDFHSCSSTWIGDEWTSSIMDEKWMKFIRDYVNNDTKIRYSQVVTKEKWCSKSSKNVACKHPMLHSAHNGPIIWM